ncbi:MAG: GNAT family N-acetyltransferase [bacterium]
MTARTKATPRLTFAPVTAERWSDFESLFGDRGACGGCWCMHWRQSSAEYDKCKGAANKRKMKKLITSGQVPGILAYAKNAGRATVAGWCSVGPRQEFTRLERSRNLRPIDDQPVWSIVCLFVDKEYRGRGVGGQLIKAAAEYAASQGAAIVEGYPFEPDKKWADAFVWTGTVSAYKKAGFREAARYSPKRPIMRKRV